MSGNKPGNGRHARREILEVTSLEGMSALADMRPWRWFGQEAAVSLRLPFIETSIQGRTERRLSFWRGVCGCQAGALFVLASLVWYIASPPEGLESTLSPVLHGAAFVLGAGLAGKVLAILIARAMFATEATLFVRRAKRVLQRERFAP
jgi:hypothetical protein